MKINIVNNTDLEIAVNKSEDGIITLTIDDAKKNEKLLGDVKPGEIVKLGEREYIVLGHDAETTVVITNDTVKDMEFGKTGDYLTSNVRKYCNGEFYNKLVAAVGAENIVLFHSVLSQMLLEKALLKLPKQGKLQLLKPEEKMFKSKKEGIKSHENVGVNQLFHPDIKLPIFSFEKLSINVMT